MITKHANDLLDEWIGDGNVEFISRSRDAAPAGHGQPSRVPPRGHPAARRMGRCRRHAVRSRHRLKHELAAEQTEEMLARLDGFQDYIYEHVQAKRQVPMTW